MMYLCKYFVAAVFQINC